MLQMYNSETSQFDHVFVNKKMMILEDWSKSCVLTFCVFKACFCGNTHVRK